MNEQLTKKEKWVAAGCYLTGMGPIVDQFKVGTPFVQHHTVKAKALDKKWLPGFFFLMAVCAVMLFLDVSADIFGWAFIIFVVYTLVYLAAITRGAFRALRGKE